MTMHSHRARRAHYSTPANVRQRYVTPVERQLSPFSKECAKSAPSSRSLGGGRGDRGIHGQNDREERRLRPAAVCRQGGEAFATCRLVGLARTSASEAKADVSSVDLRSKCVGSYPAPRILEPAYHAVLRETSATWGRPKAAAGRCRVVHRDRPSRPRPARIPYDRIKHPVLRVRTSRDRSVDTQDSSSNA